MKRIFLFLILALCMMGALLLVGCSGNTNVGTSVLPGPQTEAESSSSNQSANQNTTHGTPDEPPSEMSTDIPTEIGLDQAYINAWYDFPDWSNDFTADRTISLERFVWHLAEVGNPFRLTNSNPVEFTNGGLVIYFEPEWAHGTVAIMARDLGSESSGGWVQLSNNTRSFQVNNGAIGWLLAEQLWVTMDLGKTSTDTATFWPIYRAELERGLQLDRQIRLDELLNSHRRLEKSELSTEDVPSEWGNLMRREPVTPIDDFSIWLSERNVNFRHVGGVTWSNSYLTIEILNDTRGWGFAIYDDSGRRVEVFDDTGWYAMSDGKMTPGLTVGILDAMASCETFTTMEPVLAMEATFDYFVNLAYGMSVIMFPQQ